MVGEGRMLERVSLVAVIVGRICCIVVVMGMTICILMIFDPGLLTKAMSNKVQNLYLSGLLLPY